jgi:hypothetical protein
VASCTQIERLMQAYIDDELTPSERVIIEKHTTDCGSCAVRLRRHKSSAALLFEVFCEYRLDHDMTSDILAHLPEMDLNQQTAREVTWRAKHPGKKRRVFLTLMPALVPVLLLIFGIALIYSWPPDELNPKTVGMVTWENGQTLSGLAGDTSRKRVRLKNMVSREERFETGNNAALMITLAGPSSVKVDRNTRIRIRDERKINLEEGQIFLEVCRHARSFQVVTPTADITVFGTRFNVSVNENDSTAVTVTEGVVTVENDVAFVTVRENEQVVITPGSKPLVPEQIDTKPLVAWASAIQPDPAAQKQFASLMKPQDTAVIRAEQVFVVDNSPGRNIQTIKFTWKPDVYREGHCSYHIYVSDDRMRPMFKDYIDARMFEDKRLHSLDVVVPEDVNTAGISVLHINVLPDNSTGFIETTFTEVSAISL